MYAYRNKNTSQVVVYTDKNPRLEALKEWETVGADQVPRSSADATARAVAERASIEAAAAIRYDTAQGSAMQTVAASMSRETTNVGGGQVRSEPLPTLSTLSGSPEQATSLIPLLAKQDPARRVDATPQELNRQLAQDEIDNPPTTGVLARAKDDQRRGVTQIGPNPTDHPQPRLAAAGLGQPEGDNERHKAADGHAGSGPVGAQVDGAEGPGSHAGYGPQGIGAGSQADQPRTGAGDAGAEGGEAPRVDADADGDADGDGEDANAPEPPAKSAGKPEWVQHAVTAHGVPEAEANGMTKAQLIEKYGPQD